MDRNDVAAWLRETVTCGDLVLSGSTDPLSRLIRWGTLSEYSHCALAIDKERFLESYDWSGTPTEDDDGVGEISFDDYATRGNLLRLAVLRPSGLERQRFLDVTLRAKHYSPPFSSTVGVLLAFAGLGDHPRFRIPGVRRYVEKRLHLLGDGAARVTCSEFAARVYLESDVPLRFKTMRLLSYVELLRSPEWDSLELDAEPRRIDATGRKEEDRASLFAFVGDFPRALAAISADPSEPDWADLLVPGDFLHSSNFRTVAQIEIR